MVRLSRDDWLAAGLHLLVEEGVESITLEAACRRLNVTKGSFYHHFKNMDAFRSAMLDYWEANYTTRFIEASRTAATPEAQLQHIAAMVIDTYGTEEVAVRAWAQSDPRVRAALHRVDSRRLSFLQELLGTFYPDAAGSMARTFYAVLLGAPEMHPPASQEEFAEMYALLMRLHEHLIA
ncbi:MAG: TetR/AcrR family transcriptional regulator, partial [Anaerolineae bacterium]